MASQAPFTNKPTCSLTSPRQLTVESYHTTVPAKNNQQLLRCYFRRAQGWSDSWAAFSDRKPTHSHSSVGRVANNNILTSKRIRFVDTSQRGLKINTPKSNLNRCRKRDSTLYGS